MQSSQKQYIQLDNSQRNAFYPFQEFNTQIS